MESLSRFLHEQEAFQTALAQAASEYRRSRELRAGQSPALEEFAALRDRAADLWEIQDMARLGKWELDLVSNSLAWSDQIFEIFEIDKTRFGANYEAFLEAVHPADREAVNQAYLASLENGTPYKIQHRLKMKDGRIKWVSEVCRTEYDEQGQPLRSIGIVQDLTERLEMESELQKKTAALDLFFENTLDLLCFADTNGYFQRVNREWERVLGYTQQELNGVRFLDLVHPDDLPATLEALQELQQGRQILNFANRYLARDGASRWIEWRAVPFGELVLAVARDITERRQAELRLEKSEALLNEMGRVGKIGAWVYQLQPEEVSCTQEIYAIHELEPGETLDVKKLLSFYYPTNRQQILTVLNRAVEQLQPFDLELHITTARGSRRWVHAKGYPVEENGRVLRLMGILQDITHRKQLEEAIRASEERFRIAFEHIPLAYQSLDEQGRYLEANDSLCRLLGYTAQELIGRSFSEVWAEECQRHFPEKFAEFLEQGTVESDLRLRRKNGEKLTAFLRGRVHRSENGDVLKTHCILVDVTERQRMQALLELQNLSLESLYDGVLEFLRQNDIDALLQLLVDRAGVLLDAVYVELMMKVDDRLVVAACSNNICSLLGEQVSREEARLSWQAADSLQPAILEDYSTWEHRRAVYDDKPVYAVIELPIIAEARCLGVLSVGRDRPGLPFTPHQVRIGQLFAQVAALALQNTELHSRLREQSIRDHLTGLYNRRYLFEALEQWMPRADRERYSISFVMLDIDHFKKINDTYGHSVGDAVLAALAEVFKKMSRKGDIVCRYGGDEHIVLMYNTPPEKALERAEQLRRLVSEQRMETDVGPMQITISLGVASYPEHGATPDEVIQRADQALYQSKEAGRDRVTLAEAGAGASPAGGSGRA